LILSAPIAAALTVAAAYAQEAEPSPAPAPAPDPRVPLPADEDPISPYRLRFDTLVERSIGTTSVPVAFDWRRTHVELGATGSYLAELNNFNGMRVGGVARFPSGGLIVELGASFAASWESPTSRQLALTPYRQPGHPNRFEIDFTVGAPLAEGVVTVSPKLFPAMEMVFNGYAGLRYLLYPTGWAHLKPGEVAADIFAPALSQEEIDNLDPYRLPAMQVDSGRYGVLLGLGDDLYFKSGLFLSPRVMIAIPILAPATKTDLFVWADLALAVGVAL
jgi:hypothetical protein